ncbi:hypothetical protein [Bacillus sp. T33-2]|uniref:hypothetical protein n=1 Tax=Bacillus sp. T33-2 TaxID=2054168 RepID=UPI000C75CD3E|nr:hypothetical protein [Bacillus sp. T33-2]PLR99537.1 hypothetical protein CVD19_00305 [Bacillus sp. T33-2]
MNLSKQKVKYICEINKDLGIEDYYKRVYLSEFDMWGAKRKITKQTFNKREKEGCSVEYYKAIINLNIIQEMVIDIDTMLELAFQTNDKKWFLELTRKRNLMLGLLK